MRGLTLESESSFFAIALVPFIFIMDLVSKSQAEQLYGGTKTIIPGILRIFTLRHEGTLLSPKGFAISAWLGQLGMLLGSALLFRFALHFRGTKSVSPSGFACMIGGALGNIFSYFYHGYVIDFIEIKLFPIFNLADLALALGVFLVLWKMLQNRREVS